MTDFLTPDSHDSHDDPSTGEHAAHDPDSERVPTPVGDAMPPDVRASSPVPTRTVIITRGPDQKEPVFAWVIPLSGDNAGTAYQLEPNQTMIGRDAAKTHIILEDGAVSREHAMIVRRLDENDRPYYTLIDAGSANGTWVDGKEIVDYRLQDGSRFRIGKTEMLFKCL